ncbi:MAG: ATP-binding cassette domain-containing protein [Chlorobi bacterium]|nr:MAG: ABC transport system ATP-binding protein [Chlorobi bacterium OLB7]MBK8912684.1 ATP-binding cassette domain-containing protein [Chlorobiota bacterium]MBX7216428.1 ATP-binding cassette domain-containing protein [Candidatus Kapabacteria bacterium]
MIRITDLHKSFGAVAPACGINLTVKRSTTTTVVGRSGTGKSVLLKSIVGLIEPDRGSILVDTIEVVGAKPKVLEEIRKKVGYVFQSGALYDSMTVGENLAFPLQRTKKELSWSEIKDRVAHYLEQVGLPEKLNTMPSELSGGQRKRIGVARTIITEPECLLYDEPTTGLDPQTTREISELILHLRDNLKITGIVVTHDPYCLKIVSDNVAYIEGGVIAFEGALEEAKHSNHEFLQTFFSLD